MGLGDFIMLIDKLGMAGIVITLAFVLVMFMGSVVDIYQFLWRFNRWRKRKETKKLNQLRAQILLELHDQKEKVK